VKFIKFFGNKVRKKDVYFKYSTEEQFTGEYWIDGKKIYTKVIKETGVLSKAETSNIKHDIINLSEFVDYDVFVQGDDGLYRLPVVYYSNVTSGTFYDMFARVNGNSIQIINNSSDWSGYSVTAILYYTKNVYHDFD
jgi:hypothetical protein